jgi:hypothetical protein
MSITPGSKTIRGSGTTDTFHNVKVGVKNQGGTNIKRSITMTLEEIRAEQARIKAQFYARKARNDAARTQREANTPAKPWVVVGAIAPMSDYHESVTRGWSTD